MGAATLHRGTRRQRVELKAILELLARASTFASSGHSFSLDIPFVAGKSCPDVPNLPAVHPASGHQRSVIENNKRRMPPSSAKRSSGSLRGTPTEPNRPQSSASRACPGIAISNSPFYERGASPLSLETCRRAVLRPRPCVRAQSGSRCLGMIPQCPLAFRHNQSRALAAYEMSPRASVVFSLLGGDRNGVFRIIAHLLPNPQVCANGGHMGPVPSCHLTQVLAGGPLHHRNCFNLEPSANPRTSPLTRQWTRPSALTAAHIRTRSQAWASQSAEHSAIRG